ncbi:hypothetical protein AK830_g5394 [Neonectria ditissima]|uniref:FAD/NAD(P)-binding domain-containing protein n=1 Tax=Neonectria ditissima TaxID=78410 RepID=A0A0P7ATG5_9HYPO|nr:hypothetical protein AK830_g5394 [Neonectria ditissima]
MAHPLGTLFESAGIKFIQDTVEAIHPDEHTVDARSASGVASTQYGFDVDSLEAAIRLESHLEHLASLPPSPGRDTFVVCGGGFTGIELATELPGRFSKGDIRVILVEYADEVGPDLEPGPRPVIMKALKDIGVEVKLGSAVTEIDSKGVTSASGEYIETMTPVWTAGVRATPLTQQIPGAKDSLSRLHVD